MRYWIVLLLAALLAACGKESTEEAAPAVQAQEPEFGGEVIAEVAGTPVSEDVLAALIRLRHPEGASEAQREAARRQLIDLYVMEHAARENGMLDRRGVRAELEVQRLSRIASLLLGEYSREHPISDEQLRQEYEQTLAKTGSSEYLLHHILVGERERAEALIERLDAGNSFEELEQELAPQLGQSNAGELGWVELTQVPPSFAGALEGLEPGEYTTEPVSSDYGWHIILLQDRRALEAPELEAVAGNIRNLLTRRQLEQYVSELRKQAGVTAEE